MRFIFLCCILVHTSFTAEVSGTDDGPSEIDDQSIPPNHDSKQAKMVNKNETDHQHNTPGTEIKATIVTNIISDEITTKSTKRPYVVTRRSDIIDVSIKGSKIGNEPCIFVKIYNYLANAIDFFLNEPRVKSVIKNIGTCVVNGALDIVSFYVPAPLIPLVASVAGMVIPFDPVVSLRERMPVTSYRRAMSTAVKSFLGTFDRYKEQLVDYDEDPFMTRRLNRRLKSDDYNDKMTGVEKKRTTNGDDNDEIVTTKPKRKRNKNRIVDD